MKEFDYETEFRYNAVFSTTDVIFFMLSMVNGFVVKNNKTYLTDEGEYLLERLVEIKRENQRKRVSEMD